MTNRTSIYTLAVLWGAMVMLLAAPGWAQGSETLTVEAQYERGRKRFQAGDIQGALDDYRAVFEQQPHPYVAANLGNAAYQLGLWAEAATTLRWAVNHLTTDLVDYEEVKVKYRERFEQARARSGALTLTVQPANAIVTVDQAAVEVGSEPVFVMPGRRVVAAKLAGYATETQEVEAAPGVVTAVSLVLQPVPVAGPVPGGPVPMPPPPPDEEGDDAVKMGVGIGGMLLGVAGIGAGIGLVLAAGAKGDDAAALREQVLANNNLGAGPCGEGPVVVAGCADLLSTLESQAALKTGGVVALVAGGVVFAASATYLFWPTSEDDGTVGVRVGPGYLGVEGSF